MPRGLENAIIDFCRQLYGSVGWFGVFLAMTIESAAIPLPSEVIMPLAGWLLIQDKGHPLPYVLIAGVVGGLGCCAGSAITYWLGLAGGRPLITRYGKYIRLSEHHLELAEKWFAEKGEATAFFSRLLPVVRTFISIPAGIARMNFARFMAYTFAGSFLWCVALATGGFYTGKNWEKLRNAMRPFDYPIIVLVLVVLVLFFVRGKRQDAPSHSAGIVATPPTVTSATEGETTYRHEYGKRGVKWSGAPEVPLPPPAARSERERRPASETNRGPVPLVNPPAPPTKAKSSGAPQPPAEMPLGFYRPKVEDVTRAPTTQSDADRGK